MPDRVKARSANNCCPHSFPFPPLRPPARTLLTSFSSPNPNLSPLETLEIHTFLRSLPGQAPSLSPPIALRPLGDPIDAAMDVEYDVIVLGTGLKECILSGLLSVDRLKVRAAPASSLSSRPPGIHRVAGSPELDRSPSRHRSRNGGDLVLRSFPVA